MTTPTQNTAAFRTGPLMAQVVAACVTGGLLGTGVAVVGHWGNGDTQTLGIAAFIATAVWLVGAVIGVMLLGVVTHNQPHKLAPGVLASSTARMLIALIVGVLLFFLLSLEGRTFWSCFLLAGLFALVAESTWAIRTINAAKPAATAGAR